MIGWSAPAGQLLPVQQWIGVGSMQSAVGWVGLHLFPGHAALMGFFAISGFVLRISLQYGPQDFGRPERRFRVARLFRIYPIAVWNIGRRYRLPLASAPNRCPARLADVRCQSPAA